MMGDWSEVREGDLIKGQDGYTWTVTATAGGGQVTIEREGRDPFTGFPTGPVDFIDSDRAEMERAIAVSQVILGGEVVARHLGSREEPWKTPVTFPDAGSLLAHVYLLHGVTGSGEATLKELLKQHDDLHRDKGVGYQHHHHDPDFYKAS